MQISVESIKALRQLTGAGIMDTKNALQEANGDMAQAEEILREKGVASAMRKSSRATNQGLVESYIHSGGRIGAIVEINCETDFVARTDEYKSLAHDIAMQVAAMDPKYLDAADIPDGEDASPEQVCLLQQAFIKEPSKTVQDLVNEVVRKIGENVKIRRFSRFALGE